VPTPQVFVLCPPLPPAPDRHGEQTKLTQTTAARPAGMKHVQLTRDRIQSVAHQEHELGVRIESREELDHPVVEPVPDFLETPDEIGRRSRRRKELPDQRSKLLVDIARGEPVHPGLPVLTLLLDLDVLPRRGLSFEGSSEQKLPVRWMLEQSEVPRGHLR